MSAYRLHLPATPEAVGEVRSAVAEIAEAAGLSDRWAIRSCLSEAVTRRHDRQARLIPEPASSDRSS